jgi:hypothetical protein
MLKADQHEKFLGNLKFGEPHNFKYIITNSGDKTVVITKIVLGCNSCTKASIVKQVLGHNQDTELDVIYTPGSTGITSKDIIVQYNNGDKAEHLNLKFKAQIDK